MKQASTQQESNPLLIKRLESGFDFIYHKSCFRILTSVLYKESETQVKEEPDNFRSALDVLAKEVQQNIIHGLQVSNLMDLCSRFRESCYSRLGKEDIVTTIVYAAKAIRNVISLDSKFNIPWPPTGKSLSENNIVIPDLLYNFLALLLTDDSKHASISPSKLDISSEVKGYTETPKYVALAIYLKTQTESSEIVKIINKFGHSVSYDQAEEIETSIAEQMIMNTEDDIFIPSIIRKGAFSSFCWDNNDLCEETLTGQGTTHCTNGIVIQTRLDWCENEDETNQPPLQRSKNRSMKILTEEQPVHFYSKPRVGPKTSKQTTAFNL
ncbi:unnamed protein product [Mytilus coruscus]|uniref:Uncharacterized protein n=1 Tax=Mytilus coruscus TaxID=42192 RepID=A0A6J8B0Q0_MYTCO|nr:unnamed protein product [Mytilus coruscus]